MAVHTVLGPIEADQLGPTSMHEHCLVDARVWLSKPREAPPAVDSMSMDNLGFVRWNYDSLADNLLLDDPHVIAEELGALADVPGATIVDLSVVGLNSSVTDLPEISRRSGVQIVSGCGFYVELAQPDWVAPMSQDQLTEHILRDLRQGIDGTDIRAGIIGEIGTSNPPTERELRVVRAAGAAAVETGAAVNIHLDPFGHHALAVVEALVAEGAATDRVVLSHLDSYTALDHAYHLAIAETGAVLEFDNFGLEHYTTQQDALIHNHTDLERIEHASRLIEDGLGDQLVFGTDVYTKAQLRRFGGVGYDHLLTRIAPALRDHFGVTQAVLDQILVESPRRLLDIEASS